MKDPRVFYILLSMVLMAGCSSRLLRNFYPPGDTVEEDNYSMSSFVPSGFIVPEKLETEEFRLRMLSIDDVEKDFEAVTSSSDHLSKVWPETGWPNGLTLRQNLIDLFACEMRKSNGSHAPCFIHFLHETSRAAWAVLLCRGLLPSGASDRRWHL